MSQINLDVDRLLQGMADGLRPHLEKNPVMIGIHTGGVWLAERLHESLIIAEPLGTIDISFYRDDFTRIGMNPQVKASALPTDIDGRHVILVDDVLHTGRTVRAALNEIFDYGRPSSVILAVLIDRNERELPIQPNVVGRPITLGAHQHIKLVGPEPLALNMLEVTN